MGRKGRQSRRSRKDGTYDDNYKLLPKESKLFEEYYKGQGIVGEGEWGLWMETLLRPLPCTFRVTAFKSHCKEMVEIVKRDYINGLINNDNEKNNDNNNDDKDTITDTTTNNNKDDNKSDTNKEEIIKNDNSTNKSNDEDDNEDTNNEDTNGDNRNGDGDNGEKKIVHSAPKCLPWYPGGLAWQLNLDRKMLRVDARLKRMHQFLVEETESGFISRQEAVSMIPPILLDVKPGHKVLDMCAAPGSKTAQLVEMLHHDDDLAGAHDNDHNNDGGMVVANDSDNKRCYLMVHQLNRLLSEKYVVVNSDASNMKSFMMDGRAVLFDRVLCDVPCSGDGTLRKNVDAWHRWNPGSAHGLHNLQKRIGKRGVELCGGLMVYSTCSFNPVENEAVVAYLLNTFQDTLELVDAREKLPGLKVQEGISSWKVMTKNSEWFSSFDEVPERLRTQLAPSLFPPSPQEAKQLGLHKCIRILPHHQDTGGFFVALLRKKAAATATTTAAVTKETEAVVAKGAEVTASKETADSVAMEIDDGVAKEEDGNDKKRKAEEDKSNSRPSKKSKQFGYKEDPFIFMHAQDPVWKEVIDFYGIKDSFSLDQLMVRCEVGKKRNIYYVGKSVKELVLNNEEDFKFINMGVKMLGRSASKEVKCDYRIVQDGIHILYPHVTKRILGMTQQDIITLLTSENPYIERFDAETQEALNSLSQGGCIFEYKPQEGKPGPNCDLLLSGWKGRVSCRSFLPRADRGHYLRLCGVEDRKFEKMKGRGNEEEEVKENEVDDGDDSDTGAKNDEEDGAKTDDNKNVSKE